MNSSAGMLRVLAAVLATAMLGGCSPEVASMLCTLTVQEHHTSPDGRFMAVVYERDCGAAGATTQLSIAPAGGSVPNAPANTFIADRRTVLGVEWISPQELTVRVPAAVQPERADSTVLGIQVRYEERARVPQTPVPEGDS
jgi:hypothetical protein